MNIYIYAASRPAGRYGRYGRYGRAGGRYGRYGRYGRAAAGRSGGRAAQPGSRPLEKLTFGKFTSRVDIFRNRVSCILFVFCEKVLGAQCNMQKTSVTQK